MTSIAQQRVPQALEARVLDAGEWGYALQLALQDPVANILAITHLERALRWQDYHGEVWGFPAQGELEAVCWSGANLIPIVPSWQDDPSVKEHALRAFGELGTQLGRRSSSIVGTAELVMPLWNSLGGMWQRPRQVRSNQPSMIMTTVPQGLIDSKVRPATDLDFDGLFPASVRMFIEEVGISPLSFGSSQYAMRVRELIAEKRTLVRMHDDTTYDAHTHRNDAHEEVLFKADFGALAAGVAQIQGVWIDPHYRGRGYAVPAVAQTVAYGLENFASTVSLYVNDYNYRALKAYRKVGFEQIGEYATILF
ncbi:GNAT family N-acetyltransferase [Timonella sp. A28]|uniref:GNAT family N-acetyltransferase n=1 Tax=Timonella sp. A28 TaxID=3442640 RepID=UPI003EB974AE